MNQVYRCRTLLSARALPTSSYIVCAKASHRLRSVSWVSCCCSNKLAAVYNMQALSYSKQSKGRRAYHHTAQSMAIHTSHSSSSFAFLVCSTLFSRLTSATALPNLTVYRQREGFVVAKLTDATEVAINSACLPRYIEHYDRAVSTVANKSA